MQSLSCDTNPDWCESNQAIIPMCDFALLLSAATHTTEANTLHFNGQKILSAAITKLASLGLDKAEEVVLHGISHGGTAVSRHDIAGIWLALQECQQYRCGQVILNADKVGALLAKAAPGLKTYKAVPVDGIREQTDPLENSS